MVNGFYYNLLHQHFDQHFDYTFINLTPSIVKNTTLFLIIISFCLINPCSHAQDKQEDTMVTTHKILIVYLTRTNNTKAVAKLIQTKVGGDLMALEPLNPYPKEYNKHVAQVDEENNSGYLPPLKSKIDIAKYDMIFIGFPTWDMQVPPPVKSFLKDNDWTGKTIVPFNTNAGYGLGSSMAQLKEFSSDGNLTEIFSVEGGYEREGVIYVMEGKKAKEVSALLDKWLREIGLFDN